MNKGKWGRIASEDYNVKLFNKTDLKERMGKIFNKTKKVNLYIFGKSCTTIL